MRPGDLPGTDSARSTFGEVLRGLPAAVREGRHESVAAPGDRCDEPRVTVVVLELHSEAADMAVDDVALGNEIRAPDRIQDLVSRDDAPASAREQVQEALLYPAEVDDRFSGPDLAIDDVDLHLPQ